MIQILLFMICIFKLGTEKLSSVLPEGVFEIILWYRFIHIVFYCVKFQMIPYKLVPESPQTLIVYTSRLSIFFIVHHIIIKPKTETQQQT